MRVKFNLALEPFSVNRTYYRDRRHKTQDFRDWELSAVQSLSVLFVQQQLQKIREAFDPKLHAFMVRLNFQYPANVLYNKAGEISSRAEDLSNIEKTLIDVLFLPKYHVQPRPYGVPNVNADDKHILRLVSCKSVSPSPQYNIAVSIAVITR